MNWNGQNGHMEQQDRWNWLCSLGAISLHPDPQATFYFHLSSFSCGPYCQYYDGDTHLVELSTPYSYVLSSQSTFLDGPLVYLYFCSQDSHWLFCLDETTFPILIVESSSSSSWLWWEQSVFSWQSWLTIAMWLYAIPFTTQFSCALHFAFSWWLALGWVHLSMPSSMLSMFWIFLFVAPEKSIISFVRSQLSRNSFVLTLLFMKMVFLSVVLYFSSFQYLLSWPHMGRFSPLF